MIIDAALPLLLEHGEKVTSRQIADAAGIAEGTIFRVFADKDEVIGAVIDAVLDPEPFEDALGRIDPNQSLETVVTAAVQVAQRRVVDAWRLMSSVPPRFHDRKRRPMLNSPALVRLLLQHRHELAVDPAAAARTLRGLTMAMSHPMIVDEPATAKTITKQFLYGVARRDG
ncbi:MAG: hypothetical protein QOE63_682 [Acidimicrobiaceae bacterium]|jgi:AcrR family transcriptional regulator